MHTPASLCACEVPFRHRCNNMVDITVDKEQRTEPGDNLVQVGVVEVKDVEHLARLDRVVERCLYVHLLAILRPHCNMESQAQQ